MPQYKDREREENSHFSHTFEILIGEREKVRVRNGIYRRSQITDNFLKVALKINSASLQYERENEQQARKERRQQQQRETINNTQTKFDLMHHFVIYSRTRIPILRISIRDFFHRPLLFRHRPIKVVLVSIYVCTGVHSNLIVHAYSDSQPFFIPAVSSP